MYIQETSCCGLKEIEHLSSCASPLDAIRKLIYYYTTSEDEDGNDLDKPAFASPEFAHLIFTEAIGPHGDKPNKRHYGASLARFIRKHELGSVVASSSAVNPNSGNFVRVYTWTINHNRLSAYATRYLNRKK